MNTEKRTQIIQWFQIGILALIGLFIASAVWSGTFGNTMQNDVNWIRKWIQRSNDLDDNALPLPKPNGTK